MAKRGGLSGFSVSDIQQELKRRQSGSGRLERKAARLRAALDGIEREIAALGGSRNGTRARGTGRTMPKNKERLGEVLARLLKGKQMNVAEAAEAARRAGYKTGAAKFGPVVRQSLLNTKKFRRASRGMYTAR